MKVLKDNYTNNNEINKKIINPYPKTCTCWGCHSELEYEESDMRIGHLGLYFLDCPLCNYEIALDEVGIELTKDNIEFPTHFYHASVESGAVDLCNNEHVKKCINEAIDYFRKNKNELVWFTEMGNLYIEVYRIDENEAYEITVAKNYYSTEIPFELEDCTEGLDNNDLPFE